MTADHRVLTPGGWRTLREAVGLVGVRRARRRHAGGGPAGQRRRGAARAGRRGFRLLAHPVAVERVVYRGDEETFDLCVEGPWHNFVANGIVVHNSFNELSGRYTELPEAFYVPAPEDVRTQVGKPGAYTFETVPDDVGERSRGRMTDAYSGGVRDVPRTARRRRGQGGRARRPARRHLHRVLVDAETHAPIMHFLGLRNAETAQREIRRYAEAVEELFSTRMPVTHAAFVARGRLAPSARAV